MDTILDNIVAANKLLDDITNDIENGHIESLLRNKLDLTNFTRHYEYSMICGARLLYRIALPMLAKYQHAKWIDSISDNERKMLYEIWNRCWYLEYRVEHIKNRIHNTG